MSLLDRHNVRKAMGLARLRLRWLLHPPKVTGAAHRMFPGALRMGESEEEAAALAAREVIRSKKLFRYYGLSPNPFQGSRVLDFERAFGARVGADHALAVNSGTSALVCALAGMGIGPGDEVIVPGYTWFSTPSAVVAVGAVPIIAEVDESLTLDPADVKRRLSPHTKAIIPVHMRGAQARMDALMEIAKEHHLLVLEDVAQAAGGSFRGKPLGGIGDAGAFSFQMSKIMTAGEGGMVTTSDRNLHLRAGMYHDTAVCPHMGVSLDEWLPGLNLRMSELHAAVLLVQLARLERIVADMRARKTRLKEMIRDGLEKKAVRFRTIHDPAGDTSIAVVFFLPEAGRAERVAAALADENIPASRLYQEMKYLPHDHIDLHAFPAWTAILRKRAWSLNGGPWRGHHREVEYSEGMCPATMALLRRAVHIDVSPDLTERDLEQMSAGILEVVGKHV